MLNTHFSRIFRLLPLLAITLLPLSSAANVLKMGLKQALDKHMITVSGMGTAQGYKRLQLNLENKSGSTLQLTMEAGIIFRPDDSLQQELVLAGGEMLTLPPFRTGSVEVKTFCAQEFSSVPTAGMAFRFDRMAGAPLPEILQYIRTNRIPDDLAQRAVWAVTTGISLHSVYDDTREQMANQLVKYLSGVTGLPVPHYYRLRGLQNTPGQPAQAPKSLKIYAAFEEKLQEPKKLTLGVYNAEGEMIQQVFTDRMFGKAGHRFRVTFEADDVSPGMYYIRLKEGDNVLREQAVEVL
jgi:hypothetical protein